MMFQFPAKEGSSRKFAPQGSPSEGLLIQISSLFRHKFLIVAVSLVCFLLGIALCIIRQASYSAKSELFVYNKGVQLFGSEAIVTPLPVETALVQNQIEILQADKILLEVADILKLDADAAGARKSDLKAFVQGAVALVTGFFPTGLSRKQLPDDPKRIAVEALRRDLTVRRLGTSHVIEVVMNASDPERAATITNEIVRAYLRDQEAANVQAVQANSGWLRDRMKGLGPNTRVIAEAVPSSKRNGPSTLTILGASIVGGLFLGAAAALARDNLDKRILSTAQAAALTGSECFGAIPWLAIRRPKRLPAADISADKFTRIIDAPEKGLSWTVDHPLCDSAHTLRRVRAAALEGHRKPLPPRGRAAQTLGIISSLPGEGKTIAAANIARLFACAGYRVLLIDGVVYNAELSKMLAPDAEFGLYGVLKGEISLADCIYLDVKTDMHFLPLVTGDPRSVDIMWSHAMEDLLNVETVASYDWVIFDLPSLGFPDARAAARLLDTFVLVIEWEKTPAASIERALSECGLAKEKLLGVILNKVKKMSAVGQGFSSPEALSNM